MLKLVASLAVVAALVPGCATRGGKVALGASTASVVLASMTYHFDTHCNSDGGTCPNNMVSDGFLLLAAGVALAGLVAEVNGSTTATSAAGQ